MNLGRVALTLFVFGAWVINGANQLRILGILLAISFCLEYVLSTQRWKLRDHPPEVFSYLFWGVWVGLTGLIVCLSKEVLFYNYKTLVQTCLMIWLVYAMLRLKMNARLLYITIIVGCLIQIVAARLGYSFDRDYGEVVLGSNNVGEERIEGLVGNANVLGFVMVSGIQCALLLWRMKPSPMNLFWKAILLMFIVLATYTTFSTGSRKTTVAIAILLVVWLVWLLPMQQKNVNILGMRVVAIAACFLLATSILTFVMTNTLVGKRYDELLNKGSGSLVVGFEEDIRYDMYKEGFKMFKAHPIAGVGLGHFQVLYWRNAYSHSDYMEPLACTGLIGFILYHSFNFFLFKRLLKLYRTVRTRDERYTIGVMMLTVTVHLLLGFGAPYWSSQRPFIMLTIFVAYTWMLEKKMKEETRNAFKYPNFR